MIRSPLTQEDFHWLFGTSKFVSCCASLTRPQFGLLKTKFLDETAPGSQQSNRIPKQKPQGLAKAKPDKRNRRRDPRPLEVGVDSPSSAPRRAPPPSRGAQLHFLRPATPLPPRRRLGASGAARSGVRRRLRLVSARTPPWKAHPQPPPARPPAAPGPPRRRAAPASDSAHRRRRAGPAAGRTGGPPRRTKELLAGRPPLSMVRAARRVIIARRGGNFDGRRGPFGSRPRSPSLGAPPAGSAWRAMARRGGFVSNEDPQTCFVLHTKDKKQQKTQVLSRFNCIADPRPIYPAKALGITGKVAACSAGSVFTSLTCNDANSNDDSIFVQGPTRNPSQLRETGRRQRAWSCLPLASPQSGCAASWEGPDPFLLESKKSSGEGIAQGQLHSSSGCLVLESSDEEMNSLIVLMKQRMLFPEDKRAGIQQSPCAERNLGPSQAPAVKREGSLLSASRILAPGTPCSPGTSKNKVLSDITQSPWMQMRRPCHVQGCFLQELSDPESQLAKHFQSKKEELAQKLYSFYNCSVFEEKLPGRMEIIWNKKMQKTAGCCVTGQLKDPERQRYAKIMLSEKVCDSADRLRDTLIHELCHAATWLIHGVRDGHGRFWNLYAKRAAMIHPELPVVSRCHNYEIKYKFTYECLQCKNTIGRHSKSLDTQRFVCALCKGQLVLCQSKLKDGTPAKAPLAPFAKYVKENYSSTKRSQQGLSHGAIMKKLSADFANHP
ncbi:germ cell nuclear acidic protein [Candoia aspera]|uniref:germ cell nuclear acidic protein n=1 Tax=Candoia aspera TaxID=51853 RepID=UPI002FD87082